jgi:nitroimidazol reductase NimA-like FMN-containing flavoprotein (pyridoxamine 5'-phosphate oxidase superfamily)
VTPPSADAGGGARATRTEEGSHGEATNDRENDCENATQGGPSVCAGYGIVGAEDGKGLLPWAWVATKMNSCRTFWLATIHTGLHSDQGRPHVMPVWGVWLDDAFFFSTGRKSRKGQNLAANPACTIANDDGEEAVIVEGLATQAEDAAEQERVAIAYKKKYKMDPRSMGEPIFRVQPSRVFGFVEKTFPQSATRWKL